MKVTLNYGNKREIIVLPDDETSFYKELGEKITTITPPMAVQVETDIGTVKYSLTTRSGTLLVTENFNNIHFPGSAKKYPTVYLTCINEDKNNYKFYKLEERNGECVATYGRIGVGKGELFGERSCTYPLRMFWIKYKEKIQKGYIDQSDIYITQDNKNSVEDQNEIPETQKRTPSSKISENLYNQLFSMAKQMIQKHCISVHITHGMVVRTQELLLELYEAATVEDFNNILKSIMTVNPRKVLNVKVLLAASEADFKEIVTREENLLAAMKAILIGENQKVERDGFSQEGITVKIATSAQKEKVLSKLDDSLKSKVKTVYRIDSTIHKKRFEKYCKDNNISNIQGLWHGSRNENWLSIIENGLLLNPNAIITGKMFGNGIYFAPNSVKSWGYTSGGYWTGESYSSIRFMGLYATAYGNPLYETRAHSYTKYSLQGKNCVHAKAGMYLRNDEIIFYDEAAMVLQYLVEFAA